MNFFNSIYDYKFVNIVLIIEYIDRKKYFRDIYLFIERVKDIIIVESVNIVYKIL